MTQEQREQHVLSMKNYAAALGQIQSDHINGRITLQERRKRIRALALPTCPMPEWYTRGEPLRSSIVEKPQQWYSHNPHTGSKI